MKPRTVNQIQALSFEEKKKLEIVSGPKKLLKMQNYSNIFWERRFIKNVFRFKISFSIETSSLLYMLIFHQYTLSKLIFWQIRERFFHRLWKQGLSLFLDYPILKLISGPNLDLIRARNFVNMMLLTIVI